MSRYLALTCEALARRVYAIAAVTSHTVTVQLYRQGLHNTPRKLRAALQDQIDAVPPDEYDAILLVYGMCGLSTVGLTARHIPLVMPRVHDCITLYLGSRARYDEEFAAYPGTYWYSLDYMERNRDVNAAGLGAANLGVMEDVYQEYIAKYGQDNADYLMEAMGEWGKHYNRAVFIETGTGDGTAFEQIAQDQAARRGWLFERRQGDYRLVDMLLRGDWPADEFLMVPPEHTIVQAAGDGLIRAEKAALPHD